MKALIDTCVIVDVLQSRMPFCEDSQMVFILAASQRFEGVITAKAVTDIYYLTHRLTHDDKLTRDILGKLFDLFEIADTAGTDCRHALASQVSDYEDAVMIETARRIEADCIITRNERDYSKTSIPVISPSDFRRMIEGV